MCIELEYNMYFKKTFASLELEFHIQVYAGVQNQCMQEMLSQSSTICEICSSSTETDTI